MKTELKTTRSRTVRAMRPTIAVLAPRLERPEEALLRTALAISTLKLPMNALRTPTTSVRAQAAAEPQYKPTPSAAPYITPSIATQK